MNSKVITHDFGKMDREAARNLARLLKLLEEKEADLLANPGKYFDMASKKIAEQEKYFFKLWEALQIPYRVQANWDGNEQECISPSTIVIDRRDYEAFCAIKALINAREAGS